MAARALALTGDLRCMAAGAAALVIGALAFVLVALAAVVLPSVSGAWLVLPCVVMLAGLVAVVAWLVFGDGARRWDPSPLGAESWPW